MSMEPISLDKAKQIAKTKGLKPGKVKGTEGIQFTKGSNDRLEVISWSDFEALLKKRNLAIYESGGWMKIMKGASKKAPAKKAATSSNKKKQ